MKNYYSRKFLNKLGHHSTASIYSEIEHHTGEYPQIYARLEIRDCSDTINLQLDFEKVEELDNNLYKVRTMIEELSKLEEYLVKNTDGFLEYINNKKL